MPINKRKFLYTLFILLTTVVFLSLIIALLSAIPNAVTYHDNRGESVSAIDTSVQNNDLAESIGSICADGPFLIRHDGDGIYVFCENTRLYRIKADINSLPASDKNALMSGFIADTKDRLSELVQYMES